jgi:Protein of unknown function (DUF3800)
MRGLVEIACDESGSEGERLIGGSTDVFAHASLRLDVQSAVACIEHVRVAARSPATEVKASVVLREQNRRVLEWLIGPSGPLYGNAHVHLTEKGFHVVRKVVELLAIPPEADDPRASTSATAVALYREGPDTIGWTSWQQMLGSFNALMRARNLVDGWMAVEAFFGLVDLLRRAHEHSRVGQILGLVWDSRPTGDGALADLLDRSRADTVLDPLVPAIAAAVEHWGRGGVPVSIVHDEQAALTAERITHLTQLCAAAGVAKVNGSLGGRLVGVRFVDSQRDPRVQVADFLAGAARKIASEELNRRGSADLAALLSPYVDASSIWGDDRSWSRLGPRM